MKVFEKAGVQGKWRAWVPVYNTLIFVKLGDLNPWWLLVLWGASAVLGWVPVLGWLIGLAAFLYTLLAGWRVGLKLQKEAVWLILYFFLFIVWLGINAFDKSRWNTAIPAAPWANNFLADKTTWSGIPQPGAGWWLSRQPASRARATPPPPATSPRRRPATPRRRQLPRATPRRPPLLRATQRRPPGTSRRRPQPRRRLRSRRSRLRHLRQPSRPRLRPRRQQSRPLLRQPSRPRRRTSPGRNASATTPRPRARGRRCVRHSAG